jgi:predicted nucleic acid-binding protein
MLVVSNTSPILNLAIIHRLELLRQQFGEVLIPPAVKETMARLRQEAGFFISDELFSAVLQEAGEA